MLGPVVAAWQALLEFWFGELTNGLADDAHRSKWFQPDDEFDALCAQRFAPLLTHAADGELDDWLADHHGRLAFIVLHDQLNRNIYRGSARAFSGDQIAIQAARDGVEQGADRLLDWDERGFFYMPFEHSERILDQHLAVGLFSQLRDEAPPELRNILGNSLRFAQRHRDVIARFGRFPHRNDALGRTSSEAELEYLQTASGFGQTSSPPNPLRADIVDGLRELGNPARAVKQQAYMKSEMPFAGVATPALRKLCKEAFGRHPLDSAHTWETAITDLWRNAAVREERHAALELLLHAPYRKQWLRLEMLGLIRELVQTGAWWDFVDTLAANAMGYLLRHDPDNLKPIIREWANDPDLWIRRTSILAQLKFKQQTDWQLLNQAIEGSIDDRDFFARKAIGWALREYSKTAPDTVIDFIVTHKDQLSPLSKREGLKVLLKQGVVDRVP